MKRLLMTITVATAVAVGALVAQTATQPAQPRPGHKMGMRRGLLRHRMIQALNLTDAQKQQAKSIFQESRKSVQPIADQLQQNREALSAAIKANNTSQIQSLATQQGVLRGQLLSARSEALAKFYGILTPDQRAKADQMQQRLHDRMQRMHRNTKG